MRHRNNLVTPPLSPLFRCGIFIYSVGDFIAQTQHSAKCINTNVKAASSSYPGGRDAGQPRRHACWLSA